MRTLTRSNPFNELSDFRREFDQMFNRMRLGRGPRILERVLPVFCRWSTLTSTRTARNITAV